MPVCIRSGLAGLLAVGVCLAAAPAGAQDGMPSFASEADLRAFLATEPPAVEIPPPPPPPPPPPISHHNRPVPGLPSPPPPRGPVEHDPPSLAWPRWIAPVAGVDAGDLVQAVGDHLVVLRRGRLFSIAAAGDRLEPVDAIDAFAPGAVALRDWTAQMFAVGDMVAVTAYSAARGGTEVSRFRVSPAGALAWVDTHQLHRGPTWHTTAARVVDGQLIFFVSRPFDRASGGDLLNDLPTIARWSAAGAAEPAPLAGPRNVHLAAPLLAYGGAGLGLASVTRCDLAAAVFACDAVATLVPEIRDVHAARDAVYVWTGQTGAEEPGDPAWVYRIPHDRGRPTAIQVEGSPVDVAGFEVTPDGDRLQVLIKRPREGDSGDAPDYGLGRPALARLELARFGDGARSAPNAAYLPLPGEVDSRITRVAMVQGAVVYTHQPWALGIDTDELVAVAAGSDAPTVLDSSRNFYRMIPAGRDALVSGADAGLPFNVVNLAAPPGPALGPAYVQPGTQEHESREHDFRYRPDPDAAAGERGLLALPAGEPRVALDMLFLRRDGDSLSEAGRIAATRGARRDDGCRASCAAWWREARAVFVGDRIFALLAYELVEAELTPEGLREVRRVDFAPPEPPADRAE